MKNVPWIPICICGALAAGCAAARPAVSLDFAVASQYVFRGAVLDDEPVVQPGLRVEQAVGSGTLGAGLWSNFELSNDRDLGNEWTEYDLTLDYSRTIGRIDMSLGAARYEYPHTGVPGSTEVFALLSVNGLLLTPTLEAWYDCEEVAGIYYNFNVTHALELPKGWTISTLA